jgi:hypothetical protein
MKKRRKLLIVIFILSASFAYTQQNDSCKVLMNKISVTYNGDCKDGLADGKGVAKGEDIYAGTFKDGFPDGKGNYIYENGNNYTGHWSKGLKNGQGKFIFYIDGVKFIQKGYWKNDEYVGISNPEDFYRITNQSGIENCSIKKLDDSEVKIKISFIGAMIKNIPQNLKITTISGQLVQENKSFAIYNYTNLNNCSINFTISTSGGERTCNLSFDILKLGNYEVVITNN